MKMRQRICLKALVVVALLTGLATWGWRFFWIDLPMGTGPAGPTVDRDGFAEPWTDREVMLVGIGDSVTAGFGASPGHSYFDRLVANAAGDAAELRGINLSAVFPNLTVTNLSVSGSTSPQHARTQLPQLIRQPTNVLGIIVMTTGGNDLIHNYGRTPPKEGAMYGAGYEQAKGWITNFAARLDAMLVQAKESFPGGSHIFLANIYDPTDSIGDIHRAGLPAWQEGLKIHAAYNRIIAEATVHHDGVHLVDIHTPFLGHGIHCRQFWRTHYSRKDPHYWFHVNLEDPNDRGYDALRRLFLNEMVKVLGPSSQFEISDD